MSRWVFEVDGGASWWRERECGRTLIVVDNIAQVVTSAVVGFAHAHRVVRKVDIAVVACEVSSCCAAAAALFGLQKTVLYISQAQIQDRIR